MKHPTAKCLAICVCALLAGCGSPSRTTQLAGRDGASPFRVGSPAAVQPAADTPIMLRFWSIECLDADAPELRTLSSLWPTGDRGAPVPLDAEQIADQLDALAARGQLLVRCMPTITVNAGEPAEIRITEAVDRPDLQADCERGGEALFPFELGERFGVLAAVDRGGLINLDLDYRLESLAGSIDEPLPSVTTTSISTSFSLASGESLVLGGQRLVAESPGRPPVESVLLVVVNARAISPTPPAARHASAE